MIFPLGTCLMAYQKWQLSNWLFMKRKKATIEFFYKNFKHKNYMLYFLCTTYSKKDEIHLVSTAAIESKVDHLKAGCVSHIELGVLHKCISVKDLDNKNCTFSYEMSNDHLTPVYIVEQIDF